MIAGAWRALPGAEDSDPYIVGRYVSWPKGEVRLEVLCDEAGYVRMFASEALAEAAIPMAGESL